MTNDRIEYDRRQASECRLDAQRQAEERFGEVHRAKPSDDTELIWDGDQYVLVLPGERFPVRIAG